MKIQSNWHKRGYLDLLDQAQAELARAHLARSLGDLSGAVDGFCLKAGAVTEYVLPAMAPESDQSGKLR